MDGFLPAHAYLISLPVAHMQPGIRCYQWVTTDVLRSPSSDRGVVVSRTLSAPVSTVSIVRR
jgi:hypothetical protein